MGLIHGSLPRLTLCGKLGSFFSSFRGAIKLEDDGKLWGHLVGWQSSLVKLFESLIKFGPIVAKFGAYGFDLG